MATNKSNFEVQGLKELQKQLKTFDADIMKNATRRAAKAAMEPVAERARALAPEDGGALQESIKLSSGTTDQGMANRVAWAAVKAGGRGKKGVNGKAPGEYVLETHYGTSRGIEATPFLEDALVPHAQSVSNKFRDELTTETKKGVEKMARRHKKTT